MPISLAPSLLDVPPQACRSSRRSRSSSSRRCRSRPLPSTQCPLSSLAHATQCPLSLYLHLTYARATQCPLSPDARDTE
eukprot:1165888-Rhodomonas_salina.2